MRRESTELLMPCCMKGWHRKAWNEQAKDLALCWLQLLGSPAGFPLSAQCQGWALWGRASWGLAQQQGAALDLSADPNAKGGRAPVRGQ